MQNNFFKFLLLFKLIILSPNIILSATSDVELMTEMLLMVFLGGSMSLLCKRGFQVYREVCAACHGIRHISYRDLKGIGYSDDEIKVIASDYQVWTDPMTM